MEILTAATDWARGEVFSSRFFVLFGLLFVLATIGFWQLGRTEVAKSFVVPTLVAGLLLVTIGLGIFFANKSRINSFVTAYNTDASASIESEIRRTEKSLGEYRTIVFKIIPLIIVVAALLVVLVDKPNWRAISITTIAMMVVILFVDINANARIEAYRSTLVSAEGQTALRP